MSFLTWGSVECKTVGILDNTAASRLYELMRSLEGLSHESGIIIGRALQDVTPKYREVVAHKLIRNFKVMNLDKGPSGPDYDAFVEGLYGTTLSESSTVRGHMPKASLSLTKRRITVEIPARKPQVETNSLYTTFNTLDLSDEILQSLVDAQLSTECQPFDISVGAAQDTTSNESVKAELIEVENVDKKTGHTEVAISESLGLQIPAVPLQGDITTPSLNESTAYNDHTQSSICTERNTIEKETSDEFTKELLEYAEKDPTPQLFKKDVIVKSNREATCAGPLTTTALQPADQSAMELPKDTTDQKRAGKNIDIRTVFRLTKSQLQSTSVNTTTQDMVNSKSSGSSMDLMIVDQITAKSQVRRKRHQPFFEKVAEDISVDTGRTNEPAQTDPVTTPTTCPIEIDLTGDYYLPGALQNQADITSSSQDSNTDVPVL
ncbi:hypothetical protein H2204_006903 [Knufia peltigerae]|uniref:Uncharacterized protein n=1 Tax=Knufia peltigerae TaxID=1002370 RepID=A0AA38Y437_9EURO|nr:hypothetical protein H2204_006903 [Knufia peltigerae]